MPTLLLSFKKGAVNDNTVTSDPVDTSGADFLYVATHSWSGGNNPVLSDSKSNTWTALTLSQNFNAKVIGYYCINPVVGSGHTFTATESSSYPSITGLAFSGLTGGFVDEEAGTVSAGTTLTTNNTGPGVTPTGDNSVVITAATFAAAVGDVAVSGGGLTLDQYQTYVNSQGVGGAIAHEIQTAAASREATWSWTTSTDAVAHIAVFGPGTTTKQAYIYGRGAAADDKAKVVSDLTVLMNLDGLGRTVNKPNTLYVAGDLIVTGDTTLNGLASGSASLDDLDDVAITAPATDDVVQYDGAGWVNGPSPVAANLATHVSDTANPHAVTKAQVGLGSVEDYAVASQAEAEAGTEAAKYMTPKRTAQAIAALAPGGGGSQIYTVGITVDGGGSAISAGIKGYRSIPVSGTIVKARLLADQSGSVVFDVWKDTYANYPPTLADTITAAAKPTLSSAIKSEDTSLAGWTTAVTTGDVIGFKIDSAATITRVTLELEIQP